MKTRLHEMIQKRLFIFLLCFILVSSARAQYLILGNENVELEIGLNFGPTFFRGDLGSKGTNFIKDKNYQLPKLMKGAFITMYPNEWLGIRLAGQYTYVEGMDSISSTHDVDELWRKQRNLDFKSDMWEVYSAVEFFPLQYIRREDYDYDPIFRPYIFGGVGLFHFNPKGSLRDQNGNITWHQLQPLHTEGQGFAEYPERKNYKLTQMNLSYGAGLKYMVSGSINLGLELLYRKTFTDYIDDVSTRYINPVYFDKYLSAADAVIANKISDKTTGTAIPGLGRYAPGNKRGNTNRNDAYFSFLLKFSFRLGSNNTGYPGYNPKRG